MGPRAALLHRAVTPPDATGLPRHRLRPAVHKGGAAGSRVLQLIGNLILPGYTAPKIAWLIAHDPGAYARTARMCLPHDYLNLWLTGQFVTEPGDASGTAYFDVRTRRYGDEVLAAIDERRDWKRTLPPVAPP